MKKLNKKVKCEDGFTISIQASSFHYCTPCNDIGPYTHVELGFPSEADDLITPFAEDESDPTGTVYPNVPEEIVIQLMAKHNREKFIKR